MKGSKKKTTKGEILTFFGVVILMTKFKSSSRASLWSMTAKRNYVPAPSFGKTGMSRNRSDSLIRHVRWSEQSEELPSEMSSEKYRWLLFDGFVGRFNDYRARTSKYICIDEPATMKRKPEDTVPVPPSR